MCRLTIFFKIGFHLKKTLFKISETQFFVSRNGYSYYQNSQYNPDY